MERHGKEYRFMDATLAVKKDFFKDYMIIDEIHNLPAEICDKLNTVIDQDQIHLIGCTTSAGSLPAPFRSRLRSIYLEAYTINDLVQILINALQRKKIGHNEDTVTEIARRSKSNPRNALQNLSFSLEVMIIAKDKILTIDHVLWAFDKLGVDEEGLSEIDRKYLDSLSMHRPTGLNHLCAVLDTSRETIEYEIEPYLLQTGRIERTSKGRILSLTF